MTPLVRETMQMVASEGLDPTEVHWFDGTGCISNRVEVQQDALLTMRPPYPMCLVCWEGRSTGQARMAMHLLTAGDDPEQGIVLSATRRVPGGRPVQSPLILYVVQDGLVKFGPVDENVIVDRREAETILGFTAAWLASLSRRAEAYVPSIKPTFTNRRKMAQGKAPLYDWRTVVIEPTQCQREREHRGGTHASPRLHDRRGHLRRLASGKNVWVRPCKVGDAGMGTVFHDYRLQAA